MPTIVELPKPVRERKEKTHTTLRLINNVTFFGDSAIPEGDPIYNSVFDAAKLLAKSGYAIVNGGGPGIMKAATDGAESVKGETIAVYWQPKLASFFEGKNLANVTDEQATASNYMIRTLELVEKGDAYIVCKGGTGTISEFGMVWALAKLYYGCHKPVILYGDFWDDLIVSFQKAMYLDEIELGVLYQATTPEQILDILRKHETKVQHCRHRKAKGDESGFIIGTAAHTTKHTYELTASDYHTEHAGKLAFQDELDEFIKLVNAPAQVLDVGSGPGYDARYLSEKYSLTCIEISERFAEIAKFENPELNIITADITSYKVKNNFYKGVWARDVLHHIETKDQDATFKKLADGLVEGGILYVIVREGKGEYMEDEGKNLEEKQKFYHLFTAEELSSRAEKAGLVVKKVSPLQRSHPWLIGVFEKPNKA